MQDILVTGSDGTSRRRTFTYDALGRVMTETLWRRTSLTEDRDSDGVGDVVTSFAYYENGRGYSNANAFGHGETVEYDLFRKRTRITGPRGFVSAHYYDENGELTKLTHPDGGVMTAKHTDDGRRWERTNPLGFTPPSSPTARPARSTAAAPMLAAT